MLGTTRRSDAETRMDVLMELGWDPRTKGSDIMVLVANGVTVLRGTVDRYVTRVSAVQAAERAEGVLEVINELVVQVPPFARGSDGEVAEAARRALAWAAFVPDERIAVSVADGWITVSGSVSCAAQADDAERALSMIPGIRGIRNRLTIGRVPGWSPRPRILLVEDHVNTACALSRLLRTEGFDLICASNATEAQQLCSDDEFDLLVSDIELPDGSGWELMSQLRSRSPVSGIAYTCHAAIADVARSRDAGFDAHLSKPTPFGVILDTIRGVLNMREVRWHHDRRDLQPVTG